jgi:hypothetical protein
LDGGRAVIHEPMTIAVSGSKRRRLRDLTAKEKAARRSIKNVIVSGLCAFLLLSLLWWLLQ